MKIGNATVYFKSFRNPEYDKFIRQAGKQWDAFDKDVRNKYRDTPDSIEKDRWMYFETRDLMDQWYDDNPCPKMSLSREEVPFWRLYEIERDKNEFFVHRGLTYNMTLNEMEYYLTNNVEPGSNRKFVAYPRKYWDKNLKTW